MIPKKPQRREEEMEKIGDQPQTGLNGPFVPFESIGLSPPLCSGGPGVVFESAGRRQPNLRYETGGLVAGLNETDKFLYIWNRLTTSRLKSQELLYTRPQLSIVRSSVSFFRGR